MWAVIDEIVRVRFAEDEPGVAVAVASDGEVLHQAGYGMADLEWGQPVGTNTVFGIGSATKPFTATAVLLLERAGKLRLDEPVGAYLPDYHGPGAAVPLHHLLTHTSGIPNYVTLPGFWDDARRDRTPQEVCALIADLPLDFPPGTLYRYSNSAYHLLGMVIAAVSGMGYEEYLHQAIFAPLGMADTRVLRPEDVIPRRARGYQQEQDGGWHNADYISWTQVSAGGWLASTVEDLLRWDAALWQGRPLDADTQARMYAPVRLLSGRTEGYGFGWGLSTYRGRRVVHHAGGVPGYTSFVGRFMEERTTFLVLSNRGGFDAAQLAVRIANEVLDLAPRSLEGGRPASDETLGRCVGTYVGDFGQVRLEVTRSGHGLAASGTLTAELVPLAGDDGALFGSAADPDVSLRFEEPDPDGRFRRVTVVVPFYWYAAYRTEEAAG
ncbi:MAG TPA: serine hydrolase domain-containing protein [Ktedonobacterales bacterium]|nr:serine hydrolase domain-containing protein [Ktedonobacterales bacterium]